jgi:methionyl-tRNA formyltransferase
VPSQVRIVFFGTADLARPILAALAEQPSFAMVGVVTQPDRPRGRDLKVQPPPVKVEALARRVPVFQPERARHPEFVQQLAQLRPDLIVVAAYGQILPASILDLPQFGCLNVHTSLLPKYRGAAPIQWAILNDEPQTGVTIMKMDPGLDTGPMLTQAATPIAPGDNAQILHDRLAAMGAELLVRTIPDYISGGIRPQPQPVEGVSYARKITKEDGKLDWTQPARVLWCKVRGLTPWPGAFTYFADGPRKLLLKISQAELANADSGAAGEILAARPDEGLIVRCGTAGLRLLTVQREGGRRMSAREFLSGNPLRPGDLLG